VVICDALKDPTTVEVMLNPDGSLWQEKLSEKSFQIGTLEWARGEAIIKNVASYYDKIATPDTPFVEEVLPLDGSRFAGQLPPIVTAPTFAIRKKPTRIIALDDYVSSGVLTKDQRVKIDVCVKEHRNILVVGGTGSGKTTLTNAIIKQMVDNDPNERPVIIEDTGEIQCSAKNFVSYLTTSKTSMADLLRIILRMRPDRVIVGEVRGAEALDLLDTWNVGHAGGIATIHANNPLLALRRLKSCVSRNNDAPADIEAYIADVLDIIIHIEKDELNTAGRRVTGIMKVVGYQEGSYLTENI
jgi:type IV secretion system protein VirB11